jgi:hypothetical protein
VGLSPDDSMWDATSTENEKRLQNGDVFTKFMTTLLNHSPVQQLLSDKRFSVGGATCNRGAGRGYAVDRTFR